MEMQKRKKKKRREAIMSDFPDYLLLRNIEKFRNKLPKLEDYILTDGYSSKRLNFKIICYMISKFLGGAFRSLDLKRIESLLYFLSLARSFFSQLTPK
jgi:hypothetical protein